VDGLSFTGEGVVVVNGHNLITLRLHNLGTGDKGDSSGAVLVITFDVNTPGGMAKDDAHVTASNTTVGTPINHINARVSVRKPGNPVMCISVHHLKSKAVITWYNGSDHVSADGDLGGVGQ
jgi:hypothetical protein